LGISGAKGEDIHYGHPARMPTVLAAAPAAGILHRSANQIGVGDVWEYFGHLPLDATIFRQA
jgi:hypothetical protein